MHKNAQKAKKHPKRVQKIYRKRAKIGQKELIFGRKYDII